ncbi:pre-rRNA 2'-O-ribose RNA methyltransferase FTSJ3-like [Oscarella lobularis]|uniref:pre-rRNA 2'-O-ribose RNA methyltransferase FTSJ3-like n=1 Tax=Oscarella lobularis TaxID=121494 RepID=UPI003313FAD0
MVTTEKCRQSLQRELKGWKADCVIHDGAPNVGTAWIQDAFSQATLCLKAVKLACDFLRKGGSFVTKVFCSKDYHSLLWVFQQLFKKVSVTKPQASRNESAEISIVCQNYIVPDKIDPRMFDSKFIFEEFEPMEKLQLPAMTSFSTQKTPAEEYSELKQFNVSEFVARADFMDVLAKASELVFDSSVFLRHPLTTEDLKDCCKDIRVLGKADIRRLLTWRKKMRESFWIDNRNRIPKTTRRIQIKKRINNNIIIIKESQDVTRRNAIVRSASSGFLWACGQTSLAAGPLEFVCCQPFKLVYPRLLDKLDK